MYIVDVALEEEEQQSVMVTKPRKQTGYR